MLSGVPATQKVKGGGVDVCWFFEGEDKMELIPRVQLPATFFVKLFGMHLDFEGLTLGSVFL